MRVAKSVRSIALIGLGLSLWSCAQPVSQRDSGRLQVAVSVLPHADLVERLAKAELLGEEVLTDRARMVELDKQRNANREALAALRRIGKEHGAEHNAPPPSSLAGEKYWLLQGGGVFVRRPHEDVRIKLEEEQTRLDTEIEALRQSVKKNTSTLCELDPSIAQGSDVHKSFVELHGVSASQLEGLLAT